jgi:hypothetical protein
VRDYDYAVYYVDGYYWVYRGDAWHRSRAYGRGWAKVEVTVVPKVIDALAGFYRAFVPALQIERVRPDGLAHTFPTEAFSHGNDCAVSKTPYVSDCNYDGARQVLSQLYGPLRAHSIPAAMTPVIKFDQRPFFPPGTDAGMADSGYVYVPASCTGSSSTPGCGLHVALHGCEQTIADIGMTFVEDAGYNRWADANRDALSALFVEVPPIIP